MKANCVDFDVDSAAILELADILPEEVLAEAIRCRADSQSLRSELTPPGTSPAESALDLADQEALDFSDINKAVVVQFVLDGSPDEPLTAMFRGQVEKRAPKIGLEDSLALRIHFEDTGAFHSTAPLKSILAAARAVGLDGVFLGEASSYTVLGAPAVRLDVKLVEVNRGRVIWTGAGESKGGGWTTQQARKVAARNAAKDLPVQ